LARRIAANARTDPAGELAGCAAMAATTHNESRCPYGRMRRDDDDAASRRASPNAVAALARCPGNFADCVSDQVMSDAALGDLAVSEGIRHDPRSANSIGKW